MANEIFRIDCKVAPFAARKINHHEFVPAFDNPDSKEPTGLHYVGELSDADLALYEGIDVFPITRLGADEKSAEAAHEKLKAARAAEFRKAKAAKVKEVPADSGKPDQTKTEPGA
jgi:hypothetical protein